jgi:MarR family 2-MHQ and catechol resistance regulon transcriptional repressor
VEITEDGLITTFGRLLEAYTRLERGLGADLETRCGIPHSWFEVLLRLARSDDGQLSMGALAEQVALTSGGVTRLVDRIEAAGYVERRASRADRRVAYTALTAEGRLKLEEASKVHAGNLREVFASFGPRDLARLDTLLDRLRGAAERR